MVRGILAVGLTSVSLLAAIASAGDYGLMVDDTLTVPCRNAESSNSVCRSEAALADLDTHHLEGRPLKLAAVKIGLMHCSVWFRGPDEQIAFYQGLVRLLAAPRVFEERELLHSVGCFPYKSMRRALEDEIGRGGQQPEARRRLERAHRTIMARYRS
jgi:hypothetical protein